jgi:hypothetical protein
MTTIAASPTSNVIIDASFVSDNDAVPVVLNDNPVTAAKDAASTTSASLALAKIIAEKQIWEANAFKASNDQLYTILQRCYTLYSVMTANRDAARDLRDALEAARKKAGWTVSDSAHTLTKIVKCVFGADRRRVSAYSIALRAALAAKVSPKDLPEFIRAQGGVEELRLSQSPNAMTPKRKAEAAAQVITNSELGSVKIKDISTQLDAAKVGCQHVLIVTQEADGAFTINALVSASSAVIAALAAFHSQQKPKQEAKAAETSITTANAKRDQLIDEAAAVAVPQ